MRGERGSEREVVRGGGGSSIERFRQIRRRVDKTERGTEEERWRKCMWGQEKKGGGEGGPQRLSDTVQKLSYHQPLIPPHHLNPDTTSTCSFIT